MLLFDFQGLLEKRKDKREKRKEKEEKPKAFQPNLLTLHSSLFTQSLIYGGVAQLGEHLPCKQGVKGSNPFISTIG